MKDALDLPTYDDVVAAHERIAPYIHRTPDPDVEPFQRAHRGGVVLQVRETSRRPGAFQGAGGLQRGSFGLSDEVAAKGVATHSSGNHRAVALLCRGPAGAFPCHVVMPRTAPEAKKAAVRGYGGQITECEPSTSSREAVFAEVQAATGAEFVHPYNDPRVIAGQGTCSREMTGAG